MLAALALAVIAPWLPVPPSEATQPTALVARDDTQWPLAPGQARRHVVSLEAGQFVRVTVKQAGIDVTVRIHAPDGSAGDLVDANEGPRGWEPASLLASTSGIHVIEVAAAPTAPGAGHYVVDADPAHEVEPRDRRRLIAEAARARAAVGLGPRAVYAVGRPKAETDLEVLRQLPLAAGIFHELGETCWEAESLTFLGLVHGWRNEHEQVLDLHPRALVLWERCGDRYRYAEAHNYAAEGYGRATQYSRAIETYERGLALAREDGARDVELLLLNNAARVYNLLGDTDKALRYGEEALAAFRARDLRLLRDIALHHLARVRLRRGDMQEAADLARESLAVSRQIGDWVGETEAAITLAEIHLALGEPEQARGFLSVLTALPPAKSRDLEAAARATGFYPIVARTYEETVDVDVGIKALEVSLAFHQLNATLHLERIALISLARLHLRKGNWDMAGEAASQAAERFRESGDRFDLATALELQGAASLGQGDLVRAVDVLEKCLDLRRSIGDGQGEALVLQRLAVADLRHGHPRDARSRLEDALRLIEGVRARIANPEIRSAWVGTVRAIHSTYVETLMDLHRRDPGAGWDAKAFEASESFRARSLLDLLAESRAEIRAGVDPALVARERSLREQLGARLERQVRLPANAASPARDELAREIQVLSAEYEDVRGRLRAASSRYAALTQPEPLGLDRIRSEVLDADTLLLEYSLGAERSYLWVVGRDRFAVHELPGQDAIEAGVLRARAVLHRQAGTADREALTSLSRLLLSPARADLAGRRLLVVADGPLHHVPFGALPDERGHSLVANHEVVSAPSASVLALLRSTAGSRPRPSRTVAVLADPVFDRSDSRVAASGPLETTAIDAQLARVTRDFGFEDGRLPRLVFTRREARSILALAPDSRLALDFQASRATVQDPELKEYRYLHFATHGLLNDVRPELSGLVLSLVDRDGRDVPGLLTAPDVFNLELGADLVVLSGCRTALGKEIRGEGLIGLTRAFMYAGVPRVVASLWPVDDLTTAELMKGFYEGMLGPQQLRPAAALRRAQARMARDPRWSAPYYWA
ncbi:MAG TPA: CHAT domain-containing protein, partial [Vicinamibacteria bacterium]|nr:CHAT domain-containing protein [Vicinamibacteria bacterium]